VWVPKGGGAVSFHTTQGRLGRKSVEELLELERQVKASATQEGILMDRKSRKKLDDINWALIYKGYIPMPQNEGGIRAGRRP
jgi:hypothetical protein